jgi:hypothetical protein
VWGCLMAERWAPWPWEAWPVMSREPAGFWEPWPWEAWPKVEPWPGQGRKRP